MLGRVPSVGCYVQAAAERDPVIDRNDLLMVRCRGRMGGVEPKVESRMAVPGQRQRRQELTLEGEQDRVVPGQDAHLEQGFSAYRLEKRIDQACRPAIARIAARAEVCPGMEFPRQHHDGPFRADHG